ncbi:hypothetical protein [Thalassovita sp.]|uniref:hypothetical protein n=1 Tax=Thalassovita sp. TaxID=1979401 RepID=UPI0029DE844C|nr:hypothetical protein [Thalassovita sp.]
MRLLALVLCLVSSDASAGAWMRARGGWFIAPSVTAGSDGIGPSLYAEYGLTGWLTLGLDANQSVEGEEKALTFARLPLWTGRGGHRLAMEVGGGVQAGVPVVRSGLSYGQGLRTGWGAGWLAVDASMTVNLGTGAHSAQLDAALGLSPSDRWKAILQLQAAMDATGGISVQATPSAVYRFARSTQVELGMIQPITGGGDTRLKLGLWLEF